MDANPWFERDLVDQILDGLFCVNLLTVISLFKDCGSLFNGREKKGTMQHRCLSPKQ
ncbi:hypothetical protein HanPI659440_Chr11g0432951 [Helianthus annuus]|uniref:Uncharacterized protein n=1 Tax=Helianthus annuus TaxID=4232 RepID=A0A251VA81_HELAN|nr:hypothetical protein HanXRQr2_Chr11g0505121 [Helianthus annuus]KAJ0735512.1 hypothetical protein HanPI659440_Chr11g0432951 [Helianthus annuus]